MPPLAVLFLGLVILALGVWLVLWKSVVGKMFAIVPILGGAAVILGELQFSFPFLLPFPIIAPVLMTLLFMAWSVWLLRDDGWLVKAFGGFMLLVGFLALVNVISGSDSSVVDRAFDQSTYWIQVIFGNANVTYGRR